jgi:CheY-like chemotaxis protein
LLFILSALKAIFGKLISSCHFKCTIVDNGEEAIKAWKSETGKFQMILMDLQMPIKDGLEATKEIRAIEKKRGVKIPIPIIALTGKY